MLKFIGLALLGAMVSGLFVTGIFHSGLEEQASVFIIGAFGVLVFIGLGVSLTRLFRDDQAIKTVVLRFSDTALGMGLQIIGIAFVVGIVLFGSDQLGIKLHYAAFTIVVVTFLYMAKSDIVALFSPVKERD